MLQQMVMLFYFNLLHLRSYKMYKLTERNNGVYKDGAFIPFDPANTDYQAYLKFLEDGGIPEPAEE